MPMTTLTPFSLQAAEAFVLREGLPWQRAFWKVAFGYGPVEAMLFDLEPFHNADGGWGRGLDADYQGSVSSIGTTIAATRILTSVNLGEDLFEVWDRTLAFILAAQLPDGSWDEPAGFEQAGAPFWFERSIGNRTWFAAALGGYLRYAHAAPEAVAKATRFVSEAFQAGHFAHLHPYWMTLALTEGSPIAGAEELARACHARLLAAVTADEVGPVDLGWIHEAARMGGLPTQDPLRKAIVSRLETLQQPDGGFPSEYGDGHRVETTLHAARALVSR